MSNGLLSTYNPQGGKRLIDDASTGTQRPPRISIKDNRFALLDPSGAATEVPFRPEGPAIDIVFCDRNDKMSKLFWGLDPATGKPKPYSPSDISPPVCFSDNGVAPSAASQEPQSPTCNACPHNMIGSAISQISGARIKACADFKKFAVVVMGFQGVYLFEIKPGSFKAWNNYTNYLRMQKTPDGGRPDLSDVVTRVRFSGQGVFSFEAVALVPPGSEMANQVIAVWEKNKEQDITGMMIGRYDQPAQGVLPAPQAQRTIAAPGTAAGGNNQGLWQHADQGVSQQRPAVPPPPPPPQQQAQPLFASQQPPAPPAPAAPTQAKGRGRPRKEEAPAAIQPPPPSANVQHGLQPPAGSPPPDIGARLDSLFKLPSVK